MGNVTERESKVIISRQFLKYMENGCQQISESGIIFRNYQNGNWGLKFPEVFGPILEKMEEQLIKLCDKYEYGFHAELLEDLEENEPESSEL